MKSVFGFLKLLAFLMLCVLVVPVQLLILLFDKGRFSYVVPQQWHKAICWVFGLKLRIKGTPYREQQTLYVCNHVSYLDIPLIGSVLRASFVAKKEVAGWPVFGFLSKLQQTAFISRDKEDAATEKHALSNMMKAGKSLIIFPEGTSTDGRNVLPFKSSLFSLAYQGHAKDLIIQPMTLQMETVDGKPLKTQEDRDLYAWHNNMDLDLSVHLLRFSKCRGATITITFHSTFKANDFEDRKTLAKACHERVSNGLEDTTNAKAA